MRKSNLIWNTKVPNLPTMCINEKLVHCVCDVVADRT